MMYEAHLGQIQHFDVVKDVEKQWWVLKCFLHTNGIFVFLCSPVGFTGQDKPA